MTPRQLREASVSIWFFMLFIPMFIVMLLLITDGQAVLVAHRDTSNVVTSAALAGVAEIDVGTVTVDITAADEAVARYLAEAQAQGSVSVTIDNVDVRTVNDTTLEVRLTYTNDKLFLIPVVANIFATDEPLVQSTITRQAFICIPGVSATPQTSCQRPDPEQT